MKSKLFYSNLSILSARRLTAWIPLLLLCLFSTSELCSQAQPAKMEFTLIDLSYKGLIVNNDTIIVYGDLGSVMVSYNNAMNWKQVRIFRKGNIEKIIKESDRLVAFNDIGDIAISTDNAKTWEKVKSLNDSVFAVIEFPYGYFIRSNHQLITISHEFNKLNASNLVSNKLYYFLGKLIEYPPYKVGYKYSIACYGDYLIAETDSANFIRYDFELKLIDTVSIAKIGLCTTCKPGFQVNTDSNFLYLLADGIIFRTKNFINWDSIYTCSSYFDFYKPVNGKIYVLDFTYLDNFKPYKIEIICIDENDSLYSLNKFESEDLYYFFGLNDFAVNQEEVLIVGRNKYISKINIKDSTYNVISHFVQGTFSSTPYKLSDSSYLFLLGDANVSYSKYIYITTDDGVTFKSTINQKQNPEYNNFYTFNFQYYDEINKKIFFGGADRYEQKKGVFITDDLGKTFEFKTVPQYNFTSGMSYLPIKKMSQYQNFQKLKNNFVIPNNVFYDKAYTNIFTFDEDFNIIGSLNDTNFVIDYVHSEDINTFLVHSLNMLDSCFEIKYTTDNGKHWEMIKKYGIKDSLVFYRVVDLSDRTIMVTYYYNYSNSNYFIEALDSKSRVVQKIFECKIPNLYYNTFRKNGVCSYKDTIYLAIDDTIFYTQDIFDKSKWKYYLLPDKGFIIRNMKKFDDKFYIHYLDTNNGSWSAHYWLKITPDSSVSVVEDSRTEELAYLYIYPPYPVPAKNSVRSLIYWDPRIDIDNDDIGVIDVSGNKIEGREHITIDKLTPYSGFLTWNCAGVAPGIYFIHIKHGTNSRIMKVVISR